MADKKISELTALTGATTVADDVIAIVDTSVTETKKIAVSELQAAPLSAGTANGVTYLNSSKVLTSGSALTFDGTNLGVGIATPLYALDIRSGVSGRMASFISSGNNGVGVAFTNAADIGYIGSSKWVLGGVLDDFAIGAVANLVFGANNTEQMRLTDTGLGIGTSSPTQKLDVNGNIAMSGAGTASRYLMLNATGTYAGSFKLQAGGGSTGWGGNICMYGHSHATYPGTIYLGGSYAAAGPVLIVGSGANNEVERMRIDSSGIVTMSAYGAGAATFSSSGVISSVSDETWKIKDGIPANPTEMLNKLSPGYWYYNDEKKETFGKDRQLGFYAQNVYAAIGPEAAPVPESVTTTDEAGVETTTQKPWGYYDRSVLAVVTMALQELNAKFDAYVATHP